MKIIFWNQENQSKREEILSRPTSTSAVDVDEKVKQIIENVRVNGDEALLQCTEEYDRVKLKTIQVLPEEFDAASQWVSRENKKALLFSKQQIERYQQAFVPLSQSLETVEGVFCEKQFRPIDRIGMYVPGGSASLISTVLMLGVPAQLAGCAVKVLCTPPNRDGTINPNILYAAEMCGIDRVYKVGGAQAIAAMAYGTKTIPKVYKLFGPGNQWVTCAKKQMAMLNQNITMDMPAGPSELMIISDEYANPDFVAADLLSQAEHGMDSQVMLISTSERIANQVQIALIRQLRTLPRADIANVSLMNGCIIIVENINQAISICNEYAPEHLSMQVRYPEHYMSLIQNAGAVFLGNWTPETVGDYVTGSNHVLPTDGFARSISGLSVLDFMKSIHFQSVTQSGLARLRFSAEIMAQMEGLSAHKRAVSIRFSNENEVNYG